MSGLFRIAAATLLVAAWLALAAAWAFYVGYEAARLDGMCRDRIDGDRSILIVR